MTSTTTAQRQRQVVQAAFEWWRGKRPARWTYAEHMASPQVNCDTEAERQLALAVARYSAAKRSEPTRERV